MSKKRLEFEVVERVTCPYCGFKDNVVLFTSDQICPSFCYCEGSEGGCDEMFAVTYKHTFTITPMVAKIRKFNEQLKKENSDGKKRNEQQSDSTPS